MHFPQPHVRRTQRLARRLAYVAALGFGPVAACAVAAAPVWARAADGDRVRLTVPTLPQTPLPFSTAALEAAVEARMVLVRDGSAATEVTVTPTPTPGSVVVMSARRLEQINVVGKSPAEAARLVALAVLAVVRPSAEPDLSAGTAESVDQGATPGLAAVAPPGGAPRAWGVAAGTGISLGLAGGGTATFESLIETTFSFRTGTGWSGWQLATGLGFARATSTFAGHRLVLDTFPVRVGVRRRWPAFGGALIAGAGPALRWFRSNGFDAGSGALAGGQALLGAELPIGKGFRATATLSCDAYVEGLSFRVASTEVLRTGPFVPWLGLGVGWGAS